MRGPVDYELIRVRACDSDWQGLVEMCSDLCWRVRYSKEGEWVEVSCGGFPAVGFCRFGADICRAEALREAVIDLATKMESV